MTCIGCGGMHFTDTYQEETDTFEGHQFMAMLPGRKCVGCGWVYLDPAALQQYELLIAERLRLLGACGEYSQKFMRRVLREVPANDL